MFSLGIFSEAFTETVEDLDILNKKRKLTSIKKAINLLRRLGTNAHVWLPGVGSLNGLTAANYLLSDASTGLAPVDQVVGRANDALGGLGEELNTGWTTLGSGNILGVVSTPFYPRTFQFTNPPSGLSFHDGISVRSLGGVSQVIASQSGASACNLFQNTGAPLNISGVSVREVTGIHAVQATTAQKPILRRGAVNLLTYSGDFTNAAWTKTNTTYSGGKLLEDLTLTGHTIINSVTASVGATYTVVARLKSAERTFAFVGTNGGGIGAHFTSVNLSTGAVTVAVGTPSATAIQDGDYWIVTATSPAASSAVTISADIRASLDGVWANRSYQGVAGSGIYLFSAALFQGTYTAAQIQALGGIPITTSAPASTALGPYFWQFDGSNDSLVLGSVPFQMSDDHAVIAGAMCSSAASDKIVFSIRSAVSATPILSQLGFLAGAPDAVWRDDANTLCRPAGGGSKLNQTVVMSARKTGNNKILRVNGTQPDTTNTVALGATTVASAAIGAAVTTAAVNHMHGNIGPVIAIKGTLTDAELLLLERLVASLSGITI